MERICIIGGSGTGKTTLANNLGRKLNLPVYYIDGIHYLKNWEERDKNERDKIILEKTNEDKWVIDGTYTSTLKERLEKSDYVIYLDYSTFAQISGILGRFIKNHGKEKSELLECKERMNWKFFWWTVNWRRTKRYKIINCLQEIDNKKVQVFKTRRQLNKWYKDLFNEKMEY